MDDFDYLIEYEGEGSSLDFKAVQYKRETFHELLKDVIAMANGVMDGQKLIILGVKKKPDNTFAIRSISDEEFIDSAIYQKLIIDHIEPDIHIEYIPHLYKGSQLVGILKIPTCPDKPYLIKKDYGTDRHVRRAGESFIRKGTTTSPLMRKDIDRIFDQRKLIDAFDHHVSFYFSGTKQEKVLTLSSAVIDKLPSQRQAERIKAIITKREKKESEDQQRNALNKNLPSILSHDVSRFGTSSIFQQSTPYENRSLQTLRENLENIAETYHDDDCYELLEKKSEKINITVFNSGNKYLEDAVIELHIPEIQGLLIADKIYRKPIDAPSYSPINYISFDTDNLNYPHFKKVGNKYTYTENLGNLRHLQPKEVFSVPIRVTLGTSLKGLEIGIKITLFGKNLPNPIMDSLLIKVSH